MKTFDIKTPVADTGKTTAKKMTKTEINEDKMFAIRERIEKKSETSCRNAFQV